MADVREGTKLVSPKPQPSLSFELQRCGIIRVVVLLYSPFQCLVCQIDASGFLFCFLSPDLSLPFAVTSFTFCDNNNCQPAPRRAHVCMSLHTTTWLLDRLFIALAQSRVVVLTCRVCRTKTLKSRRPDNCCDRILQSYTARRPKQDNQTCYWSKSSCFRYFTRNTTRPSLNTPVVSNGRFR